MKRHYSRNKNNKRSSGFTLAELLIVLAILAVLVCITIPVFSNALVRAQTAVCQSRRHDFILSYKMDYILKDGKEDSAATVSAALAELGMSATPTRMSNTTFTISGLCRHGGVVTAVCGANGSICLVCDAHPDAATDDPTGSVLHGSGFNAAVHRWASSNGGTLKSEDKAMLYADYYSTHPAVKMEDEYKAMVNAGGLNHTLKGSELYWWTYPVTDGSGKLLYTVTYANNQSDSTKWTNGSSTERGRMGYGYVVIVNGKTYIRSEAGITIEPGNSDCLYQTEDALEAALIANNYKLLP